MKAPLVVVLLASCLSLPTPAEADALRQQAKIGLDVGAARIDAEAVVQVLAAPIRHLTLDARLRGVDPRALAPSAPSARLNLDLKAEAELPATGLPQASAFRLELALVDKLPEGYRIETGAALEEAGKI